MDEHGHIVNNLPDIVQRLKEYFDDLLKPERANGVKAKNYAKGIARKV